MLQYKFLLHARNTANGRTFRCLPKFSRTMSKEDIDFKWVFVSFKLYEILMTDDRHKFSSNIFFCYHLLPFFFFFLRGATIERKRKPDGKQKERRGLTFLGLGLYVTMAT
jgi:hypothetical protein